MASKKRAPGLGKLRVARSELRDAPGVRDLQQRLAKNLRSLRERAGWTQEDAAHASGLSTRTYQMLEQGGSNTTLVTLAALAAAFDVDVTRLLKS